MDLGSGDGWIVVTAARRVGARGLGVEIVPDRVARSRRNAEAAGVADRARFVRVITMYLLPEVNLQLGSKLLALAPGTRIVSHDFDTDDWMPDRSVVVEAPDKPTGRDKRSRLHLWVVPASLHGPWCGSGRLRGATLHIEQRFRRVEGRLAIDAANRPLKGRVDGRRLHTGMFDVEFDGAGLTVVVTGMPRLAGGRFERCRSG